MVLQCYTWILNLFQQIFGSGGGDDSIKYIPDDIILNILRRLPAKSIFQCQRVCKKWLMLISYEFIEMHERIGAPVIIRFCHRQFPDYYIIDGKSEKKYMAKCLELGRVDFVTSCNGLVLLSTVDVDQLKYFVFNPLLPARITSIDVVWYGEFCGFFFHPLAKEFRILFVRPGKTLHNYHVYLFGDKTWRRTAHPSFIGKHYSNKSNPAIVNRALHWCGELEHSQGVYKYPYEILIFDVITEEFSTRPIPKYLFKGRTIFIVVLVKEDRLCICSRADRDTKMDIWVLKDYAKWRWIKQYSVNLYWVLNKYPMESADNWEALHRKIKILSIHNGELWLFWIHRGLFCYQIGSNIVKKIDVQRIDGDLDVYVSYTKSLVILLHSDCPF